MQAKKLLLLPVLALLLGCCSSPNEFSLSLENSGAPQDTIEVREVSSGRILARLPAGSAGLNHHFELEGPALAGVVLNRSSNSYLMVVRPGVQKQLVLDSAVVKTRGSVVDSLANYIWRSGNALFSSHNKLLFAENRPGEVRRLFDSLMSARAARIEAQRAALSREERQLLHFQNKARAYSFLFYYGRNLKGLAPGDPFFSFAGSIDSGDPYLKTLPHIVLYALEIELLNRQDTLAGIPEFLEFIERRVKQADHRSFLKAVYLKELIESPSYWQKHVQLFDAGVLKEMLAREAGNPYAELFEQPSASYFSSREGTKAFDFSAVRPDGSAVKLSDFAGKLVLLDVWATWCGPCVKHRPYMLEIARKYQDDPRVAVLMVSIESNQKAWEAYVKRSNPAQLGHELLIPDGMNTEFGEQYLVTFVPRYLLIGPDGRIIHADLPEPSAAMERLVEEKLGNRK